MTLDFAIPNVLESFETISVPKRKVLVYLASPYTIGDKLQNTLTQFIMADVLVELGFMPYPPLWTHFWDQFNPKSYEFWMAYDREIILRCDCLLRLPGISAGSDDEVGFALANYLPVFFTVEELQSYYGPKTC